MRWMLHLLMIVLFVGSVGLMTGCESSDHSSKDGSGSKDDAGSSQKDQQEEKESRPTGSGYR